jgi:hypothetical protein
MSDRHEVISYTFRIDDTSDVEREAARRQQRVNEEAAKSIKRQEGGGIAPPPPRPGRQDYGATQAEHPWSPQEMQERRMSAPPRPGSVAGGAAQLFQNIPALRNLSGIQDPNAAGNAVGALVNAIGHRSTLMYRLMRAASALSNAADFVDRSKGGISSVAPAARQSSLSPSEREDYERYKSGRGPAYEAARAAIKNQFEQAKRTGNFEHPDKYTSTIFKGMREEEGADLAASSPPGGAPSGSLGAIAKQVAGKGMNPLIYKLARSGALGKIGGSLGMKASGVAAGLSKIVGVGGPAALALTAVRQIQAIPQSAAKTAGHVRGIANAYVSGKPLNAIGHTAGVAWQAATNPIGATLGLIKGQYDLVKQTFSKMREEFSGGIKTIARATLSGNPSQFAHGAIGVAQSQARAVGASVGMIAGGPIGAYVGGELASKIVGTLHGFIDEMDHLTEHMKEFNPILAGENLKFGLEVKMFNIQLAGKLQPLLTNWIALKEKFLQVLSDIVATPAFGKLEAIADGLVKGLGTLFDGAVHLFKTLKDEFLVGVAVVKLFIDPFKTGLTPLNLFIRGMEAMGDGISLLCKGVKYAAYGILKATEWITKYIPGLGDVSKAVGKLADDVNPNPQPPAGGTLAAAANQFAKQFISALNIQQPGLSPGAAAGANAQTGVAPANQLNTSRLPGFTPGRAAGGPISQNQPYLVGENGPEIVIPDEHGWVVNNADARQYFRMYQLWGAETARSWLDQKRVNAQNNDYISKENANRKDPRDKSPLTPFHFVPPNAMWINTVALTSDRQFDVLRGKFGDKIATEMLGKMQDADAARKSDWEKSDSHTKPLSEFMSKLNDAPFQWASGWKNRMTGGFAMAGMDPDPSVAPGTVRWRDPTTYHRQSKTYGDPGLAFNASSWVGRQATSAGELSNPVDNGGPLVGAGANGVSDAPAPPRPSTQPANADASNAALTAYRRSKQTPTQAAAARVPAQMPQANLGMNLTQNNEFTLNHEQAVEDAIAEIRKRLLNDFNVVQSETRVLAAMIDGANVADLM